MRKLLGWIGATVGGALGSWAGARVGVMTAAIVSGAATTHPASAAQEAAVAPDSVQSQIRSVLRAFYLHLENHNWEALSAYVLSPKLLERRGAPGDSQAVARDRLRGRGASHPAPSALLRGAMAIYLHGPVRQRRRVSGELPCAKCVTA